MEPNQTLTLHLTLTLILTLTLTLPVTLTPTLTPTSYFYKRVAACGDHGWGNQVLVKGAYKKEDTLFNWLQLVSTNCVRYVEDIPKVGQP